MDSTDRLVPSSPSRTTVWSDGHEGAGAQSFVDRFVSEAVFGLGEGWRIVAANPRAYELYGYPDGALLGRPVTDLCHAHLPAEIEARLGTLGAGCDTAFETLHRRLDGQVFPVEVRLQRAASPSASRFTAVIRDRTDRHRIRELLEHEAYLMASIVEPVVMADTDEVIVAWNPAAEAVYGWRAMEVIGRPLRDVLKTRFLDCTEEEAFRLLADTGRYRGRLLETHRDGRTLVIETNTVALQRPDGGRRGVLAVNRDVTTRHAAEERLRAEEARWRLALESSTDGSWDWDVSRGVVHLSSRQRGTPTTTRRELSLREAFECVHPEDRAPLAAAMRAHLRGRAPLLELEHRVRTGGEAYATVLDRGRVVERDGRGRPRRVIGAWADVSDLERMRGQLLHAERLASVGTLAAGVAHEINNPLAYVLGNLKYAVEVLGGSLGTIRTAVTPALADELSQACIALEEALEGSERVRNIVQDLRIMSRRSESERRPVDPGSVLEGALRVARVEIESRAELEVEVPALPPVLGDEARLSQVFINLLVNAAQAIAPHAGRRDLVRVRARVEGADAVVEISDTGCGIRPDVLPRIFDPFFTTKPVGQGSGLGLAICHGIVADHGGHIQVESEVGRGTTFRVVIPICCPQQLREGRGPAPVPEVAAPEPACVGRVLVVDDEPLVARALRRILSPPHQVEITEGVESALALLQRNAGFDAIFCDLHMPGKDGLAFHDELSTWNPALARRVLFVSGGASPERLRAVASRTQQPVLEKPFDPQLVRGLVEALLPTSEALGKPV